MASFNFGNPPSFTSVANTTSTPAFTGFGAPVSSITTPGSGSFGFSGFGATSTTPSATFGFGSNPATTSTGFGFGGTNIGGLGGILGTTTTTSAPTLFSGFGTTTATTTSAPTFSFSGLGTSGVTSGTSFSGGTLGGSLFPTGGTFGTNLGPFGTGTGTLGTSAFGPTSFGSSTFGAGNFGTGTSGIGGFGSSLGTNYSAFAQAWTGSSFGYFASGGLFGPTIGTSQTLLGQANASSLTNLAAALSCPLVFGDERDVILAKWNKLQAFWGTGKGVFSSNGQFVEFSPDNPFCRFKAIGYSCIPTAKNEDGFIALTINKKSTDVVAQQQQFVDGIGRVLGSRPTLSVCVEGVKPVPDNKTEVIIYILERAPTGASRRIPASELFGFLMQPNIKSQLTNLGIEAVIPKTSPTKEQLQQYLNNPPAGIDPLLWQQAKLDNPDAEHLIPVPMIGFSELQLRLKYQEQETKQHQGRLDLIAEDIVELQRSHANSVAKIAELKRKQLDLGHRVLQVMVKQETTRKMGYAIQADEEQLRVQLEALLAELNAPTQFKGRLNELISQIRMQNQQTLMRNDERYIIDSNLQDDIKQVLKQQQEGISHLINIIRQDLEDLKLMENGLKENVPSR